MKLLAFCIDGMEPSIVLAHPDEFPFFTKLCRTGLYAELLDTEPCGSIGKWFTFLTGVSYHEHGVEGGARSLDFTQLNQLRRFTSGFLWSVLNRNGYSVGLANFYGIYPAPTLQGFAWCEPHCLFSHGSVNFAEQAMAYPAELASALDFTSYPRMKEPRSLLELGVHQSWEQLSKDPRPLERALREDYYAEFSEIVSRRADWTQTRLTSCCAKYAPDVLLYYNWDLDKIQHFSWHERSRKNILLGYHHIERLLQSLCESLKPDNVLVFSDHGHASHRDLLQYDYVGVHAEIARFYQERDRKQDYVTFSDGTRVIQGQNGGIVSGTHAIKGLLMATGKDVPARGNLPLAPFRYMYTGILRLLGIEEGEFDRWEPVSVHRNWYEPEPDTIPGMFKKLKSLQDDISSAIERDEIPLAQRVCEADIDGQFHSITVPCATWIATFYFDRGRYDQARKWHEYVLSLDRDQSHPHYLILALQQLAYMDQAEGKLESAKERYCRLADFLAGTQGMSSVEEVPSLRQQISELETRVGELASWAQSLEKTIREERQQFARLQAEYEERTRWALSLEQEIKSERAHYAKLQSEFENHLLGSNRKRWRWLPSFPRKSG